MRKLLAIRCSLDVIPEAERVAGVVVPSWGSQDLRIKRWVRQLRQKVYLPGQSIFSTSRGI